MEDARILRRCTEADTSLEQSQEKTRKYTTHTTSETHRLAQHTEMKIKSYIRKKGRTGWGVRVRVSGLQNTADDCGKMVSEMQGCRARVRVRVGGRMVRREAEGQAEREAARAAAREDERGGVWPSVTH